MKVGLVLEGGAMRGMFTAGVLDILLKENIHIDGIVSVSAGALFGINYPSKQIGRVLRYNLKYLNDERYISLKNLIKTGNIVSKEFAYYQLPLTLDPFDNETFKQSKIDFYATLTNVETGEAEYIKIIDPIQQIEELRATSAMPFVSKIVEINGKKYLDGGLSDSIPIKKCQELGYDKIIVVLTRPFEYRKSRTNSLIVKIFYRKYPNLIECMLNRYREYNQCIEEIIRLNNEDKIFVIRPSQNLKIKRIEKDLNKIQSMYNLGKKDMEQNLEGLKQYLLK